MKEALIEAVKEFLRLTLMAVSITVIPFVLMGIDTKAGTILIDWKLVSIIFLFQELQALAKAIDKFLHKWGKEVGDESLQKGLTRF